jgi:membrane protease YdiL (CAAX protease family)
MKDQLYGCLLFLCASLVTLPVLLKKKLLSVPSYPEKREISVSTTLMAFALYLFSSFSLPQTFARLIEYLSRKCAYSCNDLQIETWAQASTIFTTFLLFTLLTSLQPDRAKAAIWGVRNVKAFLTYCLKGGLFCLLVYPLVMCLVQIVHYLVDILCNLPQKEQLVLSQLKEMRREPILFWSFAFIVITFVPFIEELLFRAFLQSVLVSVLQPVGGVLVTSLIFSLFHYSAAQLATNIELLVGLFLISYFMGIAYLRYKSIWVAIGMHATFNLLSLSFLILFGSI